MDTICGRTNVKALALALGGVMLVGSNSAVAAGAWTITLVNQTGQTLTVYDVKPNPPPARVPAGTVADGGSFAIDPDGFNPVMLAWDAGISKTGTAPNGLYIGLGLTEIPPLILYRVFHYKAAPGTEGKIAALQPVLLNEKLFTVTEGAVVIVVDGNWVAKLGGPSVAGACCAAAGGCSNIAYANACPNGVFLPGISCGPGVCGTGSGTVGPGGGTVTSSDGKASITFPKNCLPGDTKITIKKTAWPKDITAIVLQYPQSATAYESYTFEPHTLEFCPGAKLCMSMNLGDHNLGSDACWKLKLLIKDSVCTSGGKLKAQCDSDADCGTPGKCGLQWSAFSTTCTCTKQAGQLVARCCANPEHFSDFGLVTMGVSITNIILYPIIIFLILVLIAGTIYAGRRRAAKVSNRKSFTDSVYGINNSRDTG